MRNFFIAASLFIFFLKEQESLQLQSNILTRQFKKFVSATVACSVLLSQIIPIPTAEAGMLLFPLPYPLKNNIVLMRAGECYADSRHETQTNPVKKLRQDNSLTPTGREQVIEASKKLEEMGFQPSYIWVSNTERAYESAVILAREIQLGQNRIVPEFSFLDARGVGAYEGKNDELTWAEIHKNDETVGISYRPPFNTDGTPSDSVSTVLVRMNQLVSTIESLYSGENVVIIAPDSENLSVLQAALSSETPDESLPQHSVYAYKNGETRLLQPLVVPPSVLAISGLTQTEADANSRVIKAALMRGSGDIPKISDNDAVADWYDLNSLSQKNQQPVN